MGPRLERKKAQDNESSIGHFLSFPGRCLLVLREKPVRLCQIVIPKPGHISNSLLFQSPATLIPRGEVDFPLRLGGVGLGDCLDKQNVTGVAPKARLGKAVQLCLALLGCCLGSQLPCSEILQVVCVLTSSPR